ncbi:MAG: PilZ domain-containing protein [Nitrospiraceae bacterium]|nr:MAG: PilZ domain-containing protein [Nitrospiraceae bacterium]
MAKTSRRKRVHKRIPCNLDVQIENTPVSKVLDLSEGGVYVHTDREFEPGSIVRVTLNVNTKKLDIHARVKHADEGIGVGLMFIDLDRPKTEKLKQLFREIPLAM